MGEVVQIRDFKRREEEVEKAVKAVADKADALVIATREWLRLVDTAPSEMPPVQPMYVAPEKDGA
jgi:hypothetical protein